MQFVALTGLFLIGTAFSTMGSTLTYQFNLQSDLSFSGIDSLSATLTINSNALSLGDPFVTQSEIVSVEIETTLTDFVYGLGLPETGSFTWLISDPYQLPTFIAPNPSDLGTLWVADYPSGLANSPAPNQQGDPDLLLGFFQAGDLFGNYPGGFLIGNYDNIYGTWELVPSSTVPESGLSVVMLAVFGGCFLGFARRFHHGSSLFPVAEIVYMIPGNDNSGKSTGSVPIIEYSQSLNHLWRMARKLRVEYPVAIYHVMKCGNRYLRMMRILSDIWRRSTRFA